MKHVSRFVFFSLFILLIFPREAESQTLTRDWFISEYLLQLPEYVSWEMEDEIESFVIGVYGANKLCEELNKKIPARQIKNKPVIVKKFRRFREISDIHVLFIGGKMENQITKLFNQFGTKQILIITDSTSQFEYTMINLLSLNQGGKLFEVNKNNIDRAGLTLSDQILYLGGQETDLRLIYRQSQMDRTRLEDELNTMKAELEILNNQMFSQMDTLEFRSQEIYRLSSDIRYQTDELTVLSDNIRNQQETLEEKITLLKEREREIARSEDEIGQLKLQITEEKEKIRKGGREIQDQQMKISQQEEEMKKRDAILNEQLLRIEQQKAVLIFFLLLSLVILLMGFFIFRAYRIKKRANRILREKNAAIYKQNKEILSQKEEILVQREQLEVINKTIEKKNLDIKASIDYAMTIQQAILPMDKEIDKYFESFIIYLPKDIVSGDFYWFSHIFSKKKGEEIFFIAVVDCTGHGVPGGFLSMIGSRMLNTIINENRISQTDEILELMDKGIKRALNQSQSENDDGMDVCICKIERKEEIYLSFSGGRRSLYLIRNGNDAEIVKGDRRIIGGRLFNPRPFTRKDLVLSAGDKIYLTSDGLMDQHAPDRQKFGSKGFLAFLNSSGTLPMKSQKEKLEKKFIDFMKSEKQRDDITIVGLKL